ncbi:ABC transporter substrate-binding protein [Sutcliffiella horikoshii]|uniref:ABC transporter substrate-binding protein n=1 Tax=Sutcliffiella horikoshii TaxID=79883 RepID=UPI003CEAD08A
MKKFKLLSIILALMASLALAGCSSEGSSGDKAGKTTISFIHWRGEDVEVFNELIAKFEEENPEIKVDMTAYPSEQYQSTAQTLLRDGTTGDVFVSMPGSQFEIIQKAGFFEDLSGEEFVSNFNESLLEVGQSEGKQYALPYQLVFNQPIYNAGIFEELGLEPPTDWEGFLALCETLKENGYTPIAFPGADIGPGQFMNAMMMNNATDEEVFTKLVNGEVKLTDEWWVKTLSQFKELNDKEYFQDNALGTKHDGAIALVGQEKAAMLATGSYAMANIKSHKEDVKLNLLAPITVSESEATFEGIHTTTFMLAVNSKSEKQEQAKAFIEFLSNPENASVYANKTGQHLTVNDVNYESEVLKDTVHWMDKNTRFQPRYLIPNADVEKAVVGSIQDVLSGTDPAEAAKKAQQIVDQNLN